ncbi:male-enhanced antigen 1-like [Mercenaria mercenaria]|uniref:male-enhanced antigen 1-like n=1 Tax=Mercenaria mercenaria TaxID=6596 RepID=UPI00234F4A71|nr:male-enhanced antigen 1-like [Mercenaria mercenaria]XP_053373079.1 male-enhanced antigen 1-like [Mercenaria mercenaria]
MGPVPQPDEERDHPSHNENEIEDAEHPDVMINVDMSDSDDDDDDDDDQGYGGYIGYQALAQDGGPTGLDLDSEEEEEQTEEPMPDNDSADISDSIPEAVGCNIPEGLVHQVRHPDYPNTANLPGYMHVPDLPRPERKDILWNQERQTNNSLEKDHADKILSVMSNIQLPTSNIPDWARTISDDQWQVQVVNKLKHRTSPKNNSEVDKGDSQSGSANVTDVQEINQDENDSELDNKL